MRIVLAPVLTLLGLVHAATAAPMDDTTRNELMGVYDRYNKAVLARKWNDAAALRDAKTRADIQAELKARKKGRSDLLEMAREVVPDKIDPVHGSITGDGKKATIITVASKAVPAGANIPGGPKPGSVMRSEITLEFVREGMAWKFLTQTFGMDPSRIKPCSDEAQEREDAYDTGKDMNFGGQVRRVEFKPDHTLLVIRMFDEENCAILPSKATLAASGMNPDKLMPYVVVEMTGHPHKTDQQRAMATSLKILVEE